MKKNQTLLAVILAFVLLLGGAYVLYNKLSQEVTPDQLAVQDGAQTQEDSDGENSEGETEKVPAPDFTVYDREGNEVHLSDYVGKPAPARGRCPILTMPMPSWGKISISSW